MDADRSKMPVELRCHHKVERVTVDHVHGLGLHSVLPKTCDGCVDLVALGASVTEDDKVFERVEYNLAQNRHSLSTVQTRQDLLQQRISQSRILHCELNGLEHEEELAHKDKHRATLLKYITQVVHSEYVTFVSSQGLQPDHRVGAVIRGLNNDRRTADVDASAASLHETHAIKDT